MRAPYLERAGLKARPYAIPWCFCWWIASANPVQGFWL